GPMRAKRPRSGPIANGISVTTIRKNNTPITAPPPTRMASRMSRINSAVRAFMGNSSRWRACSSRAPQSEFGGGPQPDRAMGGRQDESTPFEVFTHERREHGLRAGVESGGRLVKQPDRPLDGNQARDR